ncbi:MAG: hypothetical protein V1797_07565 [Pseudomonadota bacterium]
MPPAPPVRTLVLVWDGPRPDPAWPEALAGLDWLGGRLPQAAWAALPGLGPDFTWGPLLGRFWPALGAAGIVAGAINLPGLWPPPAGSGWTLPCPPPDVARTDMVHLAHPPELAPETADLAAGLTWFAARRAVHPHERDTRFAEAAACSRLVFEHAARLAVERPVAWLGVGFSGLGEVCALFAGLDLNRPRLLLSQIDACAAELAALQRAEAVVLLAGGGGLVWAPGRLPAGPAPLAGPEDMIKVLHWLAGLPQPIGGPPPHPGLARLLAG